MAEKQTIQDAWAEWAEAWRALEAEIRKPFVWLLDRLVWLLR